jgi:fumarylacetoacetase
MTALTVAADDLFGLHNLPYGVYSVLGQDPRVAVRYGDHVVDLGVLLADEATFGRPSLNAFMAQGRERWLAVRAAVTEALRGNVPDIAVHSVGAVTLHLPFEPRSTTPSLLAPASPASTSCTAFGNSA